MTYLFFCVPLMKVVLVCNNRVSKWWQNVCFCVYSPFNIQCESGDEGRTEIYERDVWGGSLVSVLVLSRIQQWWWRWRRSWEQQRGVHRQYRGRWDQTDGSESDECAGKKTALKEQIMLFCQRLLTSSDLSITGPDEGHSSFRLLELL